VNAKFVFATPLSNNKKQVHIVFNLKTVRFPPANYAIRVDSTCPETFLPNGFRAIQKKCCAMAISAQNSAIFREQ
jgi:hypothetical protein